MYENKLSTEHSPYLLQHAHNPVFWYPWGEEAFALAKAQNKPIFLSIGYSTCHWCHVMEQESFEDIKTAQLLNETFVCIKVDREERPDIDAVYMSVCQSMTGAGGWPLTVLLTPEQKPFWAGTYLPKQNRYGQIGLQELTKQIDQLWKHEKEQLLSAGEHITEYLSQQTTFSTTTPTKELLHTAFAQFQTAYDAQYGGFGTAPKFPTPHHMLFLLRYAQLEQNTSAQQMAEKTLLQLARGGIFDQIGGGFSRYSTDKAFLVPHFEKMLYDNALLVMAYAELFSITENPYIREIIERTLSYVQKNLTDETGGFYCGQDADSDGEEGKYYTFLPQEIKNLLGESLAAAFCNTFDITEQGNFEGKSIPNLLQNKNYANAYTMFHTACHTLSTYRSTRAFLHKDDKILTSWNSLMIVAYTKAYQVLQKKEYLHTALRCHDFLQKYMVTPEGKLFLRWRKGHTAHSGQLDDYAFYALALLSLYETTLSPYYLKQATVLTKQLLSLFGTETEQGFYMTAKDSETLIYRPKEVYDGALPSGNSVAGMVLHKLWKLTGDIFWQQAAEKQLSFLAASCQQYPMGYSFALLTFCHALYPSQELVCVSATSQLPTEIQMFAQKHHIALLWKTPETAELLAQLAPFTASYPIPQKGTLFYLCQNNHCHAPVSTLKEVKAFLFSPATV